MKWFLMDIFIFHWYSRINQGLLEHLVGNWFVESWWSSEVFINRIIEILIGGQIFKWNFLSTCHESYFPLSSILLFLLIFSWKTSCLIIFLSQEKWLQYLQIYACETYESKLVHVIKETWMEWNEERNI